jgi:DNA invertase Pin-like site-specific DNA recombinase
MTNKGESRSAYGYIRVSNVSGHDKDGKRRQLKAIKDYCKAHRIKLKAVFEDIGVSGALEYQHRPALNDLMHQLATNGTKLVLCSNIDRVSRDMLVSELFYKACLEMGVQVVSVAQGDLTDMDDSSRVMIRQIMSSLSQYEKTKLVKRLKLARDKIKAETGKCGGRSKLSESQPDLLKTLLKLARKPRGGQRKSYKQIADDLNRDGFTNSKGNPITANYVGVVLSRHRKRAYKL